MLVYLRYECSSGPTGNEQGFFLNHRNIHEFGVLETYSDSTVLLIDKWEATNWEFARFCRKSGYPLPASHDREPPLKGAFKPAMGYPYRLALEYCEQRGMRCLTWDDWQKIVSTADSGLTFAWGKASADSFAVFGQRKEGTEVVGSKKPTLLGLYDLFGNASEFIDSYTNRELHYYEGKVFMNAGGSFVGSAAWLQLEHEPHYYPATHDFIASNVGCRCAAEYPKEQYNRVQSLYGDER